MGSKLKKGVQIFICSIKKYKWWLIGFVCCFVFLSIPSSLVDSIDFSTEESSTNTRSTRFMTCADSAPVSFSFLDSAMKSLEGTESEEEEIKEMEKMADIIDRQSISDSESAETDEIVEESDKSVEDTVEIIEDKLVYTVDVELKTNSIEESLKVLKERMNKYGCIVVSESFHISRTDQNILDISFRIPVEHYNEFLDTIKDGTDLIVSGLNKTVSNLIDIYRDNASKLKSLRIQETRLLSFMENTSNVTDMITIESKLAEVQYEIDELVNSQNKIDNDVAYSTVNMTLYEYRTFVQKEEEVFTFSEKVKIIFDTSIKEFIKKLESSLYISILFLPYLVLIALFIVITRFFTRLYKKRKKKNLK